MSLPEKSFEQGAACPLDGVRVIDMSRLVSGNMVSLQLADFGAEVIKIEDPKRGDPLRAWQTNGISVHWKVYSRNKKSVALSLREPHAHELFLDLIDTSQVLIENFRPGTLETMGLGPEILHRRDPGLIILRVSGWGQDGPYRDRPGFGTLVESMSGYASRTGFPDREPALPPTALADMVAGLYGAFATMVALRQVETRGGAGQVIDLPLLDPLFSFIATEAAIHRLTGTVLLAENKLNEGEASFKQAIRIAQAQQAKSLELRAVRDLARLWGEQGRRAEADDLLAPVYGWFTEGFDTADLREAKALLDELT